MGGSVAPHLNVAAAYSTTRPLPVRHLIMDPRVKPEGDEGGEAMRATLEWRRHHPHPFQHYQGSTGTSVWASPNRLSPPVKGEVTLGPAHCSFNSIGEAGTAQTLPPTREGKVGAQANHALALRGSVSPRTSG